MNDPQSGRTIGILGAGAIRTAVARGALAHGYRVVISDSRSVARLALLDRATVAVSGVVDGHVDAPESLFGADERPHHLCRHRHVKGDGECALRGRGHQVDTLAGSRAPSTTAWPRSRAAAAMARPSPLKLPVMSQTSSFVSSVRPPEIRNRSARRRPRRGQHR